MTNKGLRFIFAGAANTAVTYGLFALLVYLGVNYNIALVIEYVCGIFLGYVLNSYWTFSSTTSNRNNFIKYIVLYVAVFLLNAIILNVLVLLDIVGPIVGQLIALCVTTLFSFQLQNKWVFAGNK